MTATATRPETPRSGQQSARYVYVLSQRVLVVSANAAGFLSAALRLSTATPLQTWRQTTGRATAAPTSVPHPPGTGPILDQNEGKVALAGPVVWRRVRRGVALWKVLHGLAMVAESYTGGPGSPWGAPFRAGIDVWLFRPPPCGCLLPPPF